MIFESIGHLISKEEFLEKILIYIRLVEVIAKRENIAMTVVSIPSDEMIKELKEMGILSSKNDIIPLKKVLGNKEKTLKVEISENIDNNIFTIPSDYEEQ